MQNAKRSYCWWVIISVLLFNIGSLIFLGMTYFRMLHFVHTIQSITQKEQKVLLLRGEITKHRSLETSPLIEV
jgi:hypothetical protein